jgi:hypothetical protein
MDEKVVPDAQQRFGTWGQLMPWSSVNLYRWISTNISPDQWASVSIDGLDPAITGLPKQTTYRRERERYEGYGYPWQDESTGWLLNVIAVFTENAAVSWPVGTTMLFVPRNENQPLPTGLYQGVYYEVLEYVNDYSFKIKQMGDETNAPIQMDPSEAALTEMYIVRSFDEYPWQRETLSTQRFYVGLMDRDSRSTQLLLPLDPALFRAPIPEGLTIPAREGDVVDVYQNGQLIREQIPVPENYQLVLASSAPYRPSDVFDVVRLVHIVTDEEQSFDPTFDDDGTQVVQWQLQYDYTQIVNDLGAQYFYWITESTDAEPGKMSLANAKTALTTTTAPYVVFDKLMLPTVVSFDKKVQQLPHRYRQSVIRGINGYITEDNRFVLRYTKDYSLRDHIDDVSSALALKNTHEHWEMFREDQPYHIPRSLWDRITEAIVQYKLNDPTVRVPTLEREVYDIEHGTDTKYGLGDEQAFVNGELALATIIDDLEDPMHDFAPINIHEFSQLYPLETNDREQIVITMNAIYNTFSNVHVNRMFFSVLKDALSTKAKYPDLLKTSMVALHGIRPLEVNGINDD